MKKFTVMQDVSYYAYARAPFAPDARGYIEPAKLMDIDEAIKIGAADYTDDDNEEDNYEVKEEYIFVYADSEFYVAAEEDIWTEVWEEEALMSGWGYAYPAGGTADAWPPEAEYGEIRLVNKSW